MEYQLKNVITRNGILKANDDGTITISNVNVEIKIVGAPEGKFIQTDTMSAIVIPATKTTAQQPAYIEEQALAYVATNYPNT